ncbi:MAG: LamG domain-containing protein, partial [Chitinophagaceae bacterium]
MKPYKKPHLKLSLRQKFNTTRALGITAVIMIIIGGVLFYKFGYIEDTLADKIDIKQTKNIRGAGNMIHFKHQNDVIQVPHHSSLNLRDSFTIETWFLPLGFGNNFFNDPVVGKHSSGQGWEIRAGGSDRELGFMITLPNNGCRFNHCELKSPHPLQKNIWTHVAVTYEHESSTNTSFVKLYHNGILVNEGIYTGKVSMSSIDFTIGKNTEWGNRSFNGYIDDVRYWSSVRTEAEIQQNMT